MPFSGSPRPNLDNEGRLRSSDLLILRAPNPVGGKDAATLIQILACLQATSQGSGARFHRRSLADYGDPGPAGAMLSTTIPAAINATLNPFAVLACSRNAKTPMSATHAVPPPAQAG